MGIKAVLRHKLNREERMHHDDKTEEDETGIIGSSDDILKGLHGNIDIFSTLIYNEISLYNKLCKYDEALNTGARSLLEKYHTCILRSILHKYDCAYDTWIRSDELLHWSNTCEFYDLQSVKNISKYVDCAGATRRLNIGGRELINYRFGTNIEQVRTKFNDLLKQLCNDNEVEGKALCAAYELRDECRNRKACIYKDVTLKMDKCRNGKLQGNILQIRNIFGSREMRSGDDEYFDSYSVFNISNMGYLLNETEGSYDKEGPNFSTRKLKSGDTRLIQNESQVLLKINLVICAGIFLYGMYRFVNLRKYIN